MTVFLISFVVISFFGTILHFTHGWLKNGVLLHIFSAVNESTWEHMKLLVAPTLLVMVFQYIYLRGMYENLFNSLLLLLVIESMSIPILYEPLRIIFKKVHLSITILIFYISIILGLLTQYLLLQSEILIINEYMSIVIIFVIMFVFGIFTYYPPNIFLFKDPVTGRYGDTGR